MEKASSFICSSILFFHVPIPPSCVCVFLVLSSFGSFFVVFHSPNYLQCNKEPYRSSTRA